MQASRLHTLLWATFACLFAVFAGAAFLPTRPLVAVVPAWAAVVLAAMATMAAVAAAVARAGWPAQPGESPR